MAESLAVARYRAREAGAVDNDASVAADPRTRTAAEPADSDAPRLARNFGAVLGGQLVTWTMTLVWTLVVPRVLGPASFGVIVTALSVSGVLAIILGLGTRLYLMREIVMHRDQAPRLLGTAIVLRLVLSPVVAIAAVMFARIAHYSHEQSLALYLAAAMNVVVLLNDPMMAAFQAIERMKYLAWTDIINKSGQSVLGIALAVAGLGAVGLTANMAVVATVVVALSIRWLRPFVAINLRTNARMLANMIKGSVGFWALGLFYTVYLWIDTLMLSLMAGPRVVGWYGASTTLFQTLMFLPTIVGTVWLPRLVTAFKKSSDDLFETARAPLALVLALSAPVAAATAMAAGTIVSVLYGRAYGEAVPVMIVLALCIPPTYLNTMMSQVLIAAGRQLVTTWLMVAAAIANPLFNLVLIPLTQSRYHNGAIGAAAALLLTELFMTVVGVAVVGRHVFDRAAVRRCLLSAAASTAMWAVAHAAAPLGAVVALPAGVATLFALIVALHIPTEEELRFLRAGGAGLRERLAGRTTEVTIQGEGD
jgi:O-antigen/teichoic acid export membrane protein